MTLKEFKILLANKGFHYGNDAAESAMVGYELAIAQHAAQESEISGIRERLQFWKDSSDEVHNNWQADKDRAEKAEARADRGSELLRHCLQFVPDNFMSTVNKHLESTT